MFNSFLRNVDFHEPILRRLPQLLLDFFLIWRILCVISQISLIEREPVKHVCPLEITVMCDGSSSGFVIKRSWVPVPQTFQFYWICSRPIRQIEQVLNRKKSNAFSCNSRVIDLVHFVRPMNFSVVQKVGNIAMEINWKQLRAESISMQIHIHIFHCVLNSNWSDWFLSCRSSHVWVSWWSTNSSEISSLRVYRFDT